MTRRIQLLFQLAVLFIPLFAFSQTQWEDLRRVAGALTSEQLAELRKQANAGEPRAQTLVAIAFQNGTLVSRNEDLAANWLKKAADQGFPPAQNMLGTAYELGIGVSQDRALALSWYKQAARRGYPAGLFNVGNFFERDGPDQDQYRAYAWWILAADAGDPTAREALVRFNVETSARYPRIALIAGSMLISGTEVPQNVTSGLKWLELAAAKNEPSAKLRLAEMYINGRLAPKNVPRGLQMLTSVAREYAEAALALGNVYSDDEIVPHDYGEALKWYKYALTPETPVAFTRIGSFYAAGTGVSKDRMAAAMYYIIAANLGDTSAEKSLLDLQLSEDESKKAKQAAKKWLQDPKHYPIMREVQRRAPKAK